MAETTIGWVRNPDGTQGWTINPIRFRNLETGKVGHYCEKCAAGCKFCYASAMQKNYLSGLVYIASNRDKGELFFDDGVLEQVLRRRKRTSFFWADMTDLFGHWVPDAWLDRMFAVMALTPNHQHMVLTKRGERMREYMTNQPGMVRSIKWAELAMSAGPRRVLWKCHDVAGPDRYFFGYEPQPGDDIRQWPGVRGSLPNVLLGVSASTRHDLAAQIEHLRATPAAVRFLSLEPLIEDIGDIDLSGIGWVIVGGESGPGARPMDENWVRSIRDQCEAGGVPFFYKQRIENGRKVELPMLDGRQWAEFPEVGHA